MDLLTALYGRSPDLFYYVCSLTDPKDWIHLGLTNTMMYQLIIECKHRNLWLTWWKLHVSEFVIPDSLSSMRHLCCCYSGDTFDMNEVLRNGYEKLLFRHDAPIDDFVIHVAIDRGHLHILDILRARGVDLSTHSALHMMDAIAKNQIGVIEWFLDHVCSPNQHRGYWAPLVQSVVYNNIDIARLLLDRGENPEPAVRYVIRNGRLEMLRLFVKYDMSVTNALTGLISCYYTLFASTLSESEATPTDRNFILMAELLIEHGAVIVLDDNRGLQYVTNPMTQVLIKARSK